MVCHMHLRGRDKTFRASYPDGTSEILLMVPNYNFDWQSSYRWAPDSKHFPGGTRIDVIAHFDNSPFNPYQRIRRPTCASACRRSGNDVRVLLPHRDRAKRTALGAEAGAH